MNKRSAGTHPARPHRKLYRDLLIYSIPATASLIIEMLTSITDALFAARLPHDGVSALSAITLASPVIGFALALQSLFAMPVAVLVARHHRDKTERDRYLSLSIVLCVSVTCAISALTLAASKYIVHTLGATGLVANMLHTYITVQAFSNVVSAFGFTCSTAIRALGHPVAETVITTASVLVNILLNVVFAFWFNMGVVGLALATLGSEICCAAAGIFWLMRARSLPALTRAFDTGAAKRCGDIIKIGIAQGAPQILSSLTGAAINTAIAMRGMTHVAAWGAAQRVYSAAIMPIVGISQGAQTCLARAAGSPEKESADEAARAALRLSCFTGIVVSILVLLFSRPLCALVAPDPAVLGHAAIYISACCLTLAPMGATQAMIAAWVAQEQARRAIGIGIVRQASLMLLLCLVRTQPQAPVALCPPIADLIAAGAASALHARDAANR